MKHLVKNLRYLIWFLLFFFVLPLPQLVSESTPDTNITNTAQTQPSGSQNLSIGINWNLPLSQQNWSQVDFTQLNLNDLSLIFELEYQNSQNLIRSLESQLDSSNRQIQLWDLSLQSTQEELKNLQQDLNNSLQLQSNLNGIVSQLTEEAGVLKSENERYKKKLNKMWLIVGVTAAGTAIGSPLLVEGIRVKSKALIWSGVGTLASTLLFDVLYYFL